jgi:hypothetical protein
LKGQVAAGGARIDGSVHHYANDDCTFTMVRQ